MGIYNLCDIILFLVKDDEGLSGKGFPNAKKAEFD
jgi:hypothetical protein